MDPKETHSQPDEVSRIFSDALDLAPAERSGFLARACRGDKRLLLTVEKLLAAAEAVETDPLWTRSALEHEARAAEVSENSTFDRYRILERIGAGGMGAVYKAIRSGDRFSKLVAIKIVHDPDETAVQRFIEERRILSALEHPNIARLLDGGSTPEGYPFLAMEHIEGVPIDRYVEAHHLQPSQILELFRVVSTAASYAHQNLIVHRDLKPANILVTSDGTPKLLDFGIAKLIDESARKTRTGLAAMTLEYSSPEQIRGEIVGTASDVYSLGVLLYQLLSGRSPYSAASGAIDLAKRICDEEPAPLRSRDGKALDPDIGNIVAMAMRKEPRRRYASADQFGEDIRKFLGGYPILARPDTRRYRMAKFVVRNKAYVGGAIALSFAILAGIGTTIWQARIARSEAEVATSRFNDLRELANSYLFEFHDAIANLPGSTDARALVVKRALQYLGKLSKNAGANPDLQRELASAYERVSDEQGAAKGQSLGDRVAAIVTLREALAIRRVLVAGAPANRQYALDLAKDLVKMSIMVQAQSDLGSAYKLAKEAVQLLEPIVPADSPPAFQIGLADAWSQLGDSAGAADSPSLGHLDEARVLFSKAAALRENLIARHPDYEGQTVLLQASYGRLAAVYRAQGRFEEAIDAYGKVVDIDERELNQRTADVRRAFHGMPADEMVKREIAVNTRTMSLIATEQDKIAQARRFGDRSYRIFDEIAKSDPANVEAKEALADSTYSQAFILAHEHREQAAIAMYRNSLALYADVMRRRAGHIPGGLRTAYEYMADLYLEMKNPREATAAATTNVALCDKLLGIDAGNTSAQRVKAIALYQIGRADAMERRYPEARNFYTLSLAIWAAQQSRGTLLPRFLPRMEETRRALTDAEREKPASQ